MPPVHKRCLAACMAISGDFGKVSVKGTNESATEFRIDKIERDIKKILELNNDDCEIDTLAYLDSEKATYGCFGINEWQFQKRGTKVIALLIKGSQDTDNKTHVYIVCGGSRSILDYIHALRTTLSYYKKHNVMGQTIQVHKFLDQLLPKLEKQFSGNYQIVLTGHSLGGYLAVRTALFIDKWKTYNITEAEKRQKLTRLQCNVGEVVSFNPLPINDRDIHLSREQKENPITKNFKITNYVIPDDWLYYAAKNSSSQYYGEILNGKNS